MELSQAQVQHYQQQGYLLLPGLLTAAEVSELQVALPGIFARSGPEVIREQDETGAVRLAFGAHIYSEPFQKLARDRRLVAPVRQLLADDVYLHQSRINPKEGFGSGAAWAWHQDYPPWHKIDGMPKPHCVMASVFLDDCIPANSPLLVIPGSQQFGLLESQLHPDAQGRGYELHNIDEKTVATLAETHGIEPLIGAAGTVALVHCNLVHGSANNVSPWRRAIMYLIYNSVRNACTRTERPWFQNNRDFAPLTG